MNIFWFRRDLRLEDNVGLFHALNSGKSVLPIFIFDETILSQLSDDDSRVTFIHNQLEKIQIIVLSSYFIYIKVYELSSFKIIFLLI
jgi:deoxyribodipyrimidine photolyase